MGGVLSGILGLNNDFQANPYAYGLSEVQARDQYITDLQHKADLYQAQNTLAQALQAQMRGEGPNPAQLQFQDNTQTNIANAQGLIASQRGLNPALAARMGANAASSANQKAALGSALLQQQQQLAATSNLANIYGQMQQANLSHLGIANDMTQNANKLNAGVSMGNQEMAGKIVGTIANGASSAAGFGAKPGQTPTAAFRGGKIGGKAPVPGDSSQNDIVPAMLSPGEIVIPRSQATDPDKAKTFIDHLMKEQKKEKKYQEIEYGDVIKIRREMAEMEKRFGRLEKKVG